MRIRQKIIDAVNEFLESDESKKIGYTSASQLAEFLLRNFLQNPDQTHEIKRLQEEFEEIRRISESKKLEENTRIRNEVFFEDELRQLKEQQSKMKEQEKTLQDLQNKIQEISRQYKELKNNVGGFLHKKKLKKSKILQKNLD